MKVSKLTFVAWRAKAPRVRRRKAEDGIVEGQIDGRFRGVLEATTAGVCADYIVE